MIYIIMGVSGCGKSTLGAFLAEKFGWPLHEGDDFHPQENIVKMSQGEPLTDEVSQNVSRVPGVWHFAFTRRRVNHPDRLPWLLQLHEVIQRERCSGSNAFVTCSALKRLYRHIMLHGSIALQQKALPPAPPDVFSLFLHGDFTLIHQRMTSRTGHYMRADLLRSQFELLEAPLGDEENALLFDITRDVHDVAMEVEKHIISRKPQPVKL